jgi:acetyl-CoA carboxylase biotin carboxyl carrier protein
MATGRSGSKQGSKQPSRADDSSPAAAAGAGGSADDVVAIARGLAAAVSEHGLTELIIETAEVTYTVRRGGTTMVAMPATMPPVAMPAVMPVAGPAPVAAAPVAAPAPAAAAVVDEKVHIVKSPFVGTFYRKPNPDSPEYVKLNDKVSKGSVLCIIEAMKLMNEIEADVGGTLVAILAENGAPVEFDQPLFKIAVA